MMYVHPYTYLDSSFVSDDYKMFCDLGYPQLDMIRHDDGSWSIIEMLNAPVIPSMTRWSYILKNIKHQEVNVTFIKRMIERIDPRGRELWDIEDSKSAAVEMDEVRRQEHKEEFADKAFKAIRGNEGLMERIYKGGLREMNLDRIYQHIPQQQRQAIKKGMQ